MNQISQYDSRYVHRNASQFDPEFTDFDDMGPAMRIEVEAALGMATHHSRCRIKATDYDWRKFSAWMSEHGITNELMVIIFEMYYHRRLSVGTISNIRSGHYTYSATVKQVMQIMEGTND